MKHKLFHLKMKQISRRARGGNAINIVLFGKNTFKWKS